MLYRICQPFNVVRAVLFILAVVCCSLFLAVDPLGEIVFDNWAAVHFSIGQILLIVIIVQASFAISAWLIRFFDLMNIADE
jgi:hypothetical protein